MQQVTTKKFADMCSVSDANIRGMISRGSLVAVKDSQGNNLLDIDDIKNRDYLNNKRSVTQSTPKSVSEPTQLTASITTETFERITQRIEYLATLAGTAKQLEATIFEKKLDVKEWQDRYFELQHTNETLRNKIETLTLNNSELKAENERLKIQSKRPFWQRSII